MTDLGRWLGGIAMGVLALLGLIIMSRAADTMFGFFGVMIFLFGIAIIVVFVHQATTPERVLRRTTDA